MHMIHLLINTVAMERMLINRVRHSQTAHSSKCVPQDMALCGMRGTLMLEGW
jgi:hypothetical protein